MNGYARLLVLFALISLPILSLGCPGKTSIVGTWELAQWSGARDGEPTVVTTVSFDRDGEGATPGSVVVWNQEGNSVAFTVVPIWEVPVDFVGVLHDRDHMEGTYPYSSKVVGYWQATRVSNTLPRDGGPGQ